METTNRDFVVKEKTLNTLAVFLGELPYKYKDKIEEIGKGLENLRIVEIKDESPSDDTTSA